MIRARFAAALAGAAVVVTTAVAMGAAPPSNAPVQLLLVPSTPHAQDALRGTSARVIARYGAFTLVQAQGEDADDLKRAGAERRDDLQRVTLNGRSIDPTGRTSLAGKRRVDRSGLALLQFVGPVKDAWLDNVRATGVKVVTYMPEDSYLVHGSASSLEKLSDLLGSDPAVRAVMPLARTDKLGKGLRSRGRQMAAVQTVAGSTGTAARRAVRRAGTELRQGPAISGTVSQVVTADAAKLSALASNPAVVAVQPYKSPKLMDERSTQIMAGAIDGSGQPTGPGYLSFLTSKGLGSALSFGIDVTDEGLDKGVLPPPAGSHPDFYVDGNTANATRIQYETNWTMDDPDARDCGGHGTNVASIAAGFNNQTVSGVNGNVYGDGAGYHYGLGIAPRAPIGSSKIFTCPIGGHSLFQSTGSFTDITNDAFTAGSRISNNSWGSDVNGDYDVDSQEYDSLVRDPGMTEVFAAGNAGPGPASVGSPGTAKNVITVGASEGVRSELGLPDNCFVPDSVADNANDVVDFSSRGPTDDGRIKPDIVAPGSHITGASPQHAFYDGNGTCIQQFPSGNTLYSLVSGTSQATPEVTGAAALVRQWYHDTASAGNGTFPSPAMTKAILINSATDVGGASDGDGGTESNAPTDNQGWGRANLATALSSTNRTFSDQANVLTTTGEEQDQMFQRQDATKPVKITLVWTDPPGPVLGDAWVNDLDLVVDAGGKTYHGNVFANGLSVPGGAGDPRNNVENVYLPTSVSGPVSVRVIAKNIAGDGVPGGGTPDQDYALVVSNATAASGVGIASADGTTIGDQGDGDGAVEPGESFTLDQAIHNSGDSPLVAGTGSLDSGTPGLSIDQRDASYGPIAAGSTVSNGTPFVATLAAGATCGAPLSLTLSLDDGESVPITIPTGSPGPLWQRDSSDVPKSIPDGNSTGVVSTLNVPTHGLVNDLDVRLKSLTHSWDGDVKLQLTSPQGTTVVLANRPGGLDNSGDNFTNTTFDDQATRNISSGASPFTGRFRPQGDQLARFNGEDRFGTWTLRAIDRATPDSGTLRGWGLDFRKSICPHGANQAPTAAFGLDGQALVNQPITLDSKFSSDPDGQIVLREWDLNNDGTFGDATTDTVQQTYATPGNVTVGLRVTDDNDTVSTVQQTFTVGTPTSNPPPAKDTTPPKLTLGRAVSKIASAIKRGVSVRMGCSEACTITAELDLDRRTAKKLHIAASTVRVARVKSKLTKAGTKTVTLKLTRKARKGFAHQRSVKLKLVVTAVDTAGNRTVARRTLKLRR